jgi:serine/threonine protein kinase
MTQRNNLNVDVIVDGRYQLQSLLGEGGSGITYLAERLADKKVVAIKMLSLQHLNDWKQLDLFEREAQVLAHLNHPKIPKYLEYFHVDTEKNRAFYIIQQLAPGKSLNEWVKDGWCATETEIKNITKQLLGILQYLQEQTPPLIHRDIKPQNIIRNSDGQIFLVDFGSVQNVYHATMMRGITVVGTYGYMAPEQFRGQVVPASDLYGLAATVLYLLTRRSPADLPTERLSIKFKNQVQISEHFANWLETALAPDVDDRFPSAHAAQKALENRQYIHKLSSSTKTRQKQGGSWLLVIMVLPTIVLGSGLLHQHRYDFLKLTGLRPSIVCELIRNGTTTKKSNAAIIENYLRSSENRDAGVFECAVFHKNLAALEQLIIIGRSIKSSNGEPNHIFHQTFKSLYLYPCSRSKKELIAHNQFVKDSLPRLLNVLLAQELDINARNADGKTPLHIAAENITAERSRYIVHTPYQYAYRLLIQHGANPEIQDNSGKQARDYIIQEEAKICEDNNADRPISPTFPSPYMPSSIDTFGSGPVR